MKKVTKTFQGKWILPAIAVAFIAIFLTGYHFFTRSELTGIVQDVPVIMGHREGCVLCHDDVTGMAASHDLKILGCSGCHLGNPLTPDKEKAHKDMVAIPGNIDTATLTCGQNGCHETQVPKVIGSLMATAKGMVSVNRYVFGEAPDPDGPGHLSQLTDSAADTHLRQLCVTCHLGFPKTKPRPIDQKSRGGGCLACHLDYSRPARKSLIGYLKRGETLTVHPALNAQTEDDRCFGCHSRSARISLNYKGLMETELKADEVGNKSRYQVLQDGRVVEDKGADIHHQKGMVCVDCHTVREAMGDGQFYNHQAEQVEIACQDCHTKDLPDVVAFSQLDADSKKILRLRERDQMDVSYVLAKETGRPLINLVTTDGQAIRFLGKLDGKERELKPPATACTEINGHDRLSCQTCHTQWAPVCVNCHTQYEPDDARRDHYTGELVKGVWREYKSELRALPPALGVRVDKASGAEMVDTFIPGMIMTIHGIKDGKPDKQAETGDPGSQYQVFRRMFSPTFSHTVSKDGLSCQDCHLSSWAVGLGLGELRRNPEITAEELPLEFIPDRTAHPADGLPRDAWTGFLETRTVDTATRVGARPFNREEQVAVLRVGICLDCHDPDSADIDRIYNRFDWAIENRTSACVVAASK